MSPVGSLKCKNANISSARGQLGTDGSVMVCLKSYKKWECYDSGGIVMIKAGRFVLYRAEHVMSKAGKE